MLAYNSLDVSTADSPEGAATAEPLGTIQLDAHARRIASQLQIVTEAPDRTSVVRASFQQDVQRIDRAYQLAAEWATQEESISPVAEWLLDNFYVVREQIRDVRDHLPPSFFRELPKLADGSARVHVIARELISHCDCALDEELIVRFVDQFQLNAELTIGETWAFPVMLRLVLVEHLSSISNQLVQEYQAVRDVESILDEWNRVGRFSFADGSSLRCAPTLLALSQRLQDKGLPFSDAQSALNRYLQSLGWNLADLRRLEQHRLAANQVSMGNIITSMRLLGSLDWVSFFEQTNRTERVLQRDPLGVYGRMDFASRNRYRDVVEQLARRSSASETSIAELAVLKAESIAPADDSSVSENDPAAELSAMRSIQRHVGYWLVDDGRPTVEKDIGYHPAWLLRCGRFLQRNPGLTYFGALTTLTLAMLLVLLAALWNMDVSPWMMPVLMFCAAIPITEIAVQLTNKLITLTVPVRTLPKLEFRDGVPPEFPTFILIPCLLSSIREAHVLLARLENHYLANPEPNFLFALLTDFSDAAQQTLPEDDGILRAAMSGIRGLNERHGGASRQPFFLFHRERRWNARENLWMGWERKRGKLMEFGQLLSGRSATTYVVQEGDLQQLEAFRDQQRTPFVITLDADTILPRGAGARLVGTLAHPLNRPITATVNEFSTVKRGYSILQPRVSIHLGDAGKTRYLQVHASSPGIDPYASAASDVYQDLFAEGSFTGKGIYDLRAFELTLHDAFPENHILSHDLIEGCHARVAFASDIEVYDGYPTRYDTDAKRLHRWVRGDWQISRWLFPTVPMARGLRPNSLSRLSRWKIFDNLRRSLVTPFLLTLLIVGWLLVPRLAWWWTTLAAVSLGFPILIQLIFGLRGWTKTHSIAGQLRAYWKHLQNVAEQSIYAAMFLPCQALQMVDAIGRTLYRMIISRRRLLEWETAAVTEHRLGQRRWVILQRLSLCTFTAIGVFLVLSHEARNAAIPWLSLWLIAPMIGHLISQPRHQQRDRMQLQDDLWLRQLVSGTWAYFERYVTAAGHWLPPDNVQEYPREKIACRISPTNEGLYLVSGLVARRFGLIGISSLIERWEQNLSSWQSLEQLHGHHFNWYEIRELKALHPRYVSAVDSGNLMACYLTLADGIADLSHRPVVSETQHAGIVSSLNWLRQQIIAEEGLLTAESTERQEQFTAFNHLLQSLNRSIRFDNSSWDGLRQWLLAVQQAALRLDHWAETHQTPPRPGYQSHLSAQAAIVAQRCRSVVDDAIELLPWLKLTHAVTMDETFGDPAMMDAGSNTQSLNDRRLKQQTAVADALGSLNIPAEIAEWLVPNVSLRELAQLPELLGICESPDGEGHPTRPLHLRTSSPELVTGLCQGANVASAMLSRLNAIVLQCEQAAHHMDFRFLYNSRRKLFSIGYNADVGKLDRAHYDLLCSECRITSYLAIAKGDVETEHWFRLGRQATLLDGRYSLLSWGGTMFEFLMPQLFHKTYEGSLIATSCRTAIQRQMQYGQQRNVPWGISESAYSAMASNSDYQYKSFGVPGLGLKRGLSKDLVVSPYSSALAVPFTPRTATSNLKALAETALGRWGFYDAVDYTPSRLRAKQSASVVRNYMAHHQAMTLVALGNALLENVVVNWFHAHPLVRANELLLQERVPALVNSEVPNPDEVQPPKSAREEVTLVSRQIVGVQATSPRVLLLSNGSFSSMLTHTGGGYSRHHNTQLTRWRSDPTLDNWGTFLYLRDCDTQEVWSATYQPTRIRPDYYEALFAVDKGEIHRRQGSLETVMELVVSPDHAAETRQLRITNHGSKPRHLEVTSYAEVVLCSQAADVAHPAFQKLFVETEFIAEDATLLARRRPRDAQQEPVFALHTLAVPTAFAESVDYETSREEFVGRGRTTEYPIAMECDRLTRTTGAVLDPVFSLRCTVIVPPAGSVTLGFTTAIATNREQALSIADLFHDLRGVQRAFEMAWAFTQVEMRHLKITANDVQRYQQLGGLLLYRTGALRGDAGRIAANQLGQDALWRYGISGDSPILLLRVSDTPQIAVVKEAVAAMDFLISRGLNADLVISNDYPGAYFDALQEQLQAIVDERNLSDAAARRLFLLRGAQLSRDDHQLLDAVATVLMRGGQGSLAQQLEAAMLRSRQMSVPGTSRTLQSLAQKQRSAALEKQDMTRRPSDRTGEFGNRIGRFIQDGQRYEMTLDQRTFTPSPWSNVMANARLGCLMTEGGSGYTWFENSRENKLTVWSNDPVSDPPSEVIYVRDMDSGSMFSPLVSLGLPVSRHVIHGQGFSAIHTQRDGLQTDTLITVAESDPIKFVRLRLHNTGSRDRRLQVTYYAETVLGADRSGTVMHQVSQFDDDCGCLTMRNGYHPDYRTQIMFLGVRGGDKLSFTADRCGFLGRDGSLQQPVGLSNPLDNRTGAALDPCLTVQVTLTIGAGDTQEVMFLLGAEHDLPTARQLLLRYQDASSLSKAMTEAISFWDAALSTLTIQTPNRAMDILVNRWLPYQVLSCRLWGRSAFYQSGGAYGFRDQLQDVMALLYSRPDLAREHILRAAARQYVEGDVQHWWHPPGGKGTRTRFSDDFLFLPFVTLHYLKVTNDLAILQESIPFLESPPLTQHEQERYEQPEVSNESAPLLEHCRRALAHGQKLGQHGLPLMGCGDWNDGMNKIGEGGQGESVWVAWFQIVIFKDFARLMDDLGDGEAAEIYRQYSEKLLAAIEEHAWDGQWYRRAFFDDGTPLGSSTNEECQIDSLTQSWAVLAGGDNARSRMAFQSAVERLVVDDPGMLLLFAPPFDTSALAPGYIKGYVPGVRENGGQYSHAAMWMVQAATALNDGDLAVALFDRLNPILHTDTFDKTKRYRVEPYVIAADVYANSQHIGRGGWTWYTGSASWMYRVAIESILGIHISETELTVNPVLPATWDEFRLTYRRNQTIWQIHVRRWSGDGPRDPSSCNLVDDGQTHNISLSFT